jgi:alpha-N-arabinofuranosidase
MLEDRKFYYPVTSKPPEQPAGPAWRRRGPLRHWTPVGGDDVVSMDTKGPYTGDHTPLIKLSGSEAHGVRQTGLAVRKGKTYTGRVVLAGSSGAVVNLTLAWGSEASERQTQTIRVLGSAYRRFPLSFRAQADSDDAQVEITGIGTGSFHIGAVSLMPVDNIEGYRAEDAARQCAEGNPAACNWP